MAWCRSAQASAFQPMCSTQNPPGGSGCPSGGFAPSTAQASSRISGRFSRCPQITAGSAPARMSSVRRRVSLAEPNPMVNAWSAWTDMAASVAYGRTVATHRSAAELNTRARA